MSRTHRSSDEWNTSRRLEKDNDLILSGRMKPLLAMPPGARDAALSEIIGRAFPERPDDR